MRVPEFVRTEVTGNPVRPAIAALARTSYVAAGAGRLRLLVLAVSLGARVFSDVVPAALALLPGGVAGAAGRWCSRCGPKRLERVRAATGASGVAAELSPFFADVRGAAGGGASGDRARRCLDRGGTGGGGAAGDFGASAGGRSMTTRRRMRGRWRMPAARG